MPESAVLHSLKCRSLPHPFPPTFYRSLTSQSLHGGSSYSNLLFRLPTCQMS